MSFASRSRSALRYAGRRLGEWRRSTGAEPTAERDGFSPRDLVGYPNNHNYQLRGSTLIPSFGLFYRWDLLSSLYPEPLETLLDIGSCRGYFVLEAASRPTCRLAVGIDVHAPFVETSEKVRQHLGLEKASFHLAFLREVIERPGDFGAPFQTILLFNTYHYLFWGSQLAADHYSGHRQILEGLASICTDRVIFSNPLEVEDSPEQIRKMAAENPQRRPEYTTARFFEAAEGLFSHDRRGRIGKRPIFVLRKAPGG